MGIKGLPGIIRDVAGEKAIKEYPFSHFKGHRVAVDADFMLHVSVTAITASGKHMRNDQGEITSHIFGFFNKAVRFLENEMIPIFVFDGKPPKIKGKTLERRKERKLIAEERMKEIDDETNEEYIKLLKQSYKPIKSQYDDIKILLDLMGIPYIVAPGEGDVVCSWLASRYETKDTRYVDGICSDDSDMIPLGGQKLYKDMVKNMNRKGPIKVINLNDTLVGMNLTMEEFIDLSVLLGCDYCDNIKGIGAKRAYKLITEHKSLEKIIKLLKKREEYEDYDFQCMIDARDYFRNAANELDEMDDFILPDLRLSKYQYEPLIDFLCVKNNFDIIRVQNALKRLDLAHKKMNITRPNTKKSYKMIHPPSKYYSLGSYQEIIDFVSSDEEEIPSKKNSKAKDLIKKI